MTGYPQISVQHFAALLVCLNVSSCLLLCSAEEKTRQRFVVTVPGEVRVTEILSPLTGSPAGMQIQAGQDVAVAVTPVVSVETGESPSTATFIVLQGQSSILWAADLNQPVDLVSDDADILAESGSESQGSYILTISAL